MKDAFTDYAPMMVRIVAFYAMQASFSENAALRVGG